MATKNQRGSLMLELIAFFFLIAIIIYSSFFILSPQKFKIDLNKTQISTLKPYEVKE